MYCRADTNSNIGMKTLFSYRPIIRYSHGTESERVYTTHGSMTRFCSRAVDAPSFMRITMRHLPLLHLDTQFPTIYHLPAIFILPCSNWNFLLIHISLLRWNPIFANIILSCPLFLFELYTSCMYFSNSRKLLPRIIYVSLCILLAVKMCRQRVRRVQKVEAFKWRIPKSHSSYITPNILLFLADTPAFSEHRI